MSMARKIVTLCDPHLSEHDAEVEGQTYRLGIEGPNGRWVWVEVDLCPEDASELAQLSTFLDKYGREFTGPDQGSRKRGRPPASPGPDEDPVSCPGCGKVFKNDQSLRAHTRTQHGKKLGELKAEAAGEEPPPPVEKGYVCPECGKEFERPQALGSHLSRTHGIKGKSNTAAE